MLIRLLAFLALLSAAAPALAQHDAASQGPTVRVCPTQGETAPPDFDGPRCRDVGLGFVDAQNTALWVKREIEIAEGFLRVDRPLGVFVLAKASSEVWVNGALIGANGRPGINRREEVPGRMDAVLHVPRDLLRVGGNEIVLRMSSHHGHILLRNPTHGLFITDYGEPSEAILRAYWPSLITFGAFVIGFIAFAVAAARGGAPGSAELALMALFAGTQLIVEAGRGLFAYAYPWHDVRLVALALLASAFGLALSAYLLRRFTALGLVWRLAALFPVLGLHAFIFLNAEGYDAKTAFILIDTALLCLAAMIWWSWRRKPDALPHLGALAAFVGVGFWTQGQFLDLYFYYLVAGALILLLARDALALVRERRIRRAEESRARQLEIALEQVRQQAEPAQLNLVSAGKMERVSTEQIAQLKGAGDYVEVCFADGRTALYNGALNALEDELPPTFLRVHRSHIVNTAFVKTLTRDPSGVGVLALTTGEEAPVSRRIMPKVRSALAAG
jgi:DNA-binding LytR/AlgR family response regulator